MEGNKSEANGEAKQDDVMAKIAGSSVKDLETMAKLKDAVCAAGLVGVADGDGGEFTKVKCTLNPDESDARAGVIWVGSLPGEVSDAVFTEVMSLSTNGGKSIELLKSFRERSKQPAHLGSGGQEIWQNSQ